MGGEWRTLLGYELAVKERLRESTPTLLPTPTPYPFPSALPLGGYEVLMPVPESPGSTTRAVGWEFISERERAGHAAGESPCVESSLLPCASPRSPKQDRHAFFSPGPFLLSLPL